MKKLVIYLAALVVVASAAVGFVVWKNNKDSKPAKTENASGEALPLNLASNSKAEIVSGYKCAVADNAMAVLRFDINQLLEKSGIKEELTNMLISQLKQEGAPELVVNLVNNPRNTGVDVEAPMYAYVKLLDKDNMTVGFVAKIHNKEMLDNLLALLPVGSKVEESGCTLVQMEDNVVLAYNDVALVVGVVTPMEQQYDIYGNLVSGVVPDVKPLLVKSLQNATANNDYNVVLPAYVGSDAAICLNMREFGKLVKQYIIAEAHGEYNAEVTQALNILDLYTNGKVDVALNFADGSINLDAMAVGFENPVKFTPQPCSNKNLSMVSADALAVVNVPFNGSMYVDAIKTLLNTYPEMRQAVNEILAESGASGFDVDMALNFVYPLLSSVNGDLTLAINSVKPINKGYVMTADVDACAVVNVTNSSIMSALEMTGATSTPEVKNLGNGSYAVDADEDIKVTFGQKDDLLYISTAGVVAPKHNSATAASWYPAIQNSYAYAVVSISSLCSIPEFIQEVEKGIRDEVGYDESMYQASMKAVKSLDYLLFTAPTSESVSLRLVLKNKKENALKQYVDMIKPLVYQNL